MRLLSIIIGLLVCPALASPQGATRAMQQVLARKNATPPGGSGPVLVSATVASNGTDVTLVWDEAATRGAGWSGSNINIDNTSAGDNITWAYGSGDGTTTWTGSISGATIYVWKTPNIDFDGNANAVEDGGGTDAASFTSSAMVNNSAQIDAVVYQNFEGTGYDNSETWTEATSGTATVDEDYATSPAPLIGSQSFRVVTTTGHGESQSPTHTAVTEVWGYCLWRPVTTQVANRIIITVQNSTTDLLVIRRNSDGTLRVAQGSAVASTVGTTTAGTTYHIWWRYNDSSGANDGIGEVAFSTDGIMPTSGDNFAQVTAGTQTIDANNVLIGSLTSGSADEYIFDRVIVRTTAAIGNIQ